MTRSEFAKLIDHTALKPDTTREMIHRLCEEAKLYSFRTVCIAPYWISEAKNLLMNSQVDISTVVGFPLGNILIKEKVSETIEAINQGSDEIDAVMNIGAFLSGETKYIFDEITAIVNASKSTKSNVLVKIIIETCYLTKEQIITASHIVEDAGADFVKTSTGFAPKGALASDVETIKSSLKKGIGIKAAGGIRDLSSALAMIKAGATRLGCSASVSIINEIPDKRIN